MPAMFDVGVAPPHKEPRSGSSSSAHESTSGRSTNYGSGHHIRRRLGRRKSMPFGVYSRTLRTLRAMCEPIERVSPHGAWLWRLRNSADD